MWYFRVVRGIFFGVDILGLIGSSLGLCIYCVSVFVSEVRLY